MQEIDFKPLNTNYKTSIITSGIQLGTPVSIYNEFFGSIPNVDSYKTKLTNNFIEIIKKYFEAYISRQHNSGNYDFYNFIHPTEKIMVHFKFDMLYPKGNPTIEIYYEDIVLYDKIKKRFKKVLYDKSQTKSGYLNIITHTINGFGLKLFSINDTSFNKNHYSDDFIEINKLIKEKLIKTTKGLVLLHGEAGTGKTTYLRYLITTLTKKIIYLPPNMVHLISSPDFITFLGLHPNSILVIEDSESVLKARVHNNENTIANILNLTDGLLSDCLNIQIIATFNANLAEIDSALLRKGRLIAKHEFTKLNITKTNRLLKSLGYDVTVQTPMVLANIMNYDEKSFVKEKTKMGFK